MTELIKPLEAMMPEERQQWNEDGYAIIRNALSTKQIAHLTREIYRLDEKSQRRGRNPDSLFDVADIVNTAVEGLFSPDQNNPSISLQSEPNNAFLQLIYHPRTLGLVCEVMGATIEVTWRSRTGTTTKSYTFTQMASQRSQALLFPQSGWNNATPTIERRLLS